MTIKLNVIICSEENGMSGYQEDRQQIVDLLTGWIHRDLGEWEQLRNLFSPERHYRNHGLRELPVISLMVQYAWASRMYALST